MTKHKFRQDGFSLGRKTSESRNNLVGVLELALPDDQHAPAPAAQLAGVLLVVRDIPRELVRPELPVVLGGGSKNGPGEDLFLLIFCTS